MKGPRKDRMRITVDLPPDIYYGVQKGAINSYVSMTMYIVRALQDRFEKEGIYLDDSDRKFFEEVTRRRSLSSLTKPEKSVKLKKGKPSK
jgi:hypothetical protein